MSCGEEINAQSRICIYCGAQQPADAAEGADSAGGGEPRDPNPDAPARWYDTQAIAERVADRVGPRRRGPLILVATVAVVGVIALVVAVGGRHPGRTDTFPAGSGPSSLGLGGDALGGGPPAGTTKGAPGTTSATGSAAGSLGSTTAALYQLYRDRVLMAFVPRGWKAAAGSSGGSTDTVAFSDPADAQSRATVAITRPASGSLRSRAQALAASAGAPPGSTHIVQLPGGTAAYRVAFAAGGVAHALYAFTACHATVGVDVTVQAPGTVAQLLAGPLDALAPSVAPLC